MSNRIPVVMLLVGAVSGCAAVGGKDTAGALLNPPRIHDSADATSEAGRAGQLPIDNYYKAMRLAQPEYKDRDVVPSDPKYVKNYVEEGLGLVDAYCLRWFRLLEDTQRKTNFEEKNFNVIRQLGTALLGIGKASSNWVTGYGAANTAYSGIVENFNTAFLAGPTTKKVKDRIFELLNQSSARLLTAADTLSFAQAYNRLERHAEICSFAMVIEVLDSSLAGTESEIDTTTGRIITRPLQTLQSSFEADETSARLTNFWMPQGKFDDLNERTLVRWMQQNGLGQVPLAMLVNSRLYSEARRKAVRELAIPEVPK